MGHSFHKRDSNVRFHVIEESPNESLYFYSHHIDHLQLTAIVRTFLTDRGYYTITYKKGLEFQMKKKEIKSWVERLKTIQVQDGERQV